MRQHIGPLERLQPGTKVRIGSRVGHVVSHKEVPAVPSGTIVVHTIRITHKEERGIGRETKLVKLDRPRLVKPNYSFVEVLKENNGNN